MDYKEKIIELLNSKELSEEQIKKLEDIFPELKNSNSNDERIRKAMIEFFSKHCNYETYFGVTVKNILNWLNKRDINLLNNEEYQTLPVNVLNRLYASEKELMQIKDQRHTEWSENDKGMLLEIKCLVDSLHSNGVNVDYSENDLQEMWNWLDTIWRRVAFPKQNKDLSDDDICKIEDALFKTYAVDFAIKLLNKVKNSVYWKPSKDQIYALSDAIDTYCGKYKATLCKLYNDLNSLITDKI